MLETTSRSRPEKIGDIEHLRAVAIGFTLLAHIRFLYDEQPRWLIFLLDRLEFWGGVDLFFVISGFVICKKLFPQWRSLSGDMAERVRFVSGFWLKRVRRLVPASWFWAIVSLAVAGVVKPVELRKNIYDVIAALLQVYNWHAYFCAVGRGICSHLAVGVYWSLSLEEQIYIFLPIALGILRRRLELFVIGFLAASFALQAWHPLLTGFVRLDGFGWGMLLALLYEQPHLHATVDHVLLRPLGRLKYLATGLLLLGLAAIAKGGVASPLSYPLIAGCSAALVLLASYDRNYLVIPRFLHRALAWLGARSYSIYLVHIPVFTALHYVGKARINAHESTGQILWPALSMIMIAGLSEASFRFIEERWRYRDKAGKNHPTQTPGRAEEGPEFRNQPAA